MINVDGPAKVAPGEDGKRVEAVFKEAEMKIGEAIR